MRLIINSNRIIAALVKDSTSKKIILEGNLELLSINVSEDDVKRYKKEILKKSELTEAQFDFIYEKLKEKLIILDDKIIMNKMEEAKRIMDKIDKDDTPFIAAAIATKSSIWSDDKHFEKQNRIKILKTNDLIK
ncbi:hypothetical protein HYT56_03055 [Candidatus Woesearchaeota archaeon]|nr:hypothetical protein [Candidatus Woesearchaeota archaeon]